MTSSKHTVLVTGGAGYIGSHTTLLLQKAGYSVRVLDDLSLGHRNAVDPELLVVGDIADKQLVSSILKTYGIAAVIHFAANTLVEESVKDPHKYFLNNTYKTDQLLSAMIDSGVKHLIFSSTAAIYGEPVSIPIVETDPKEPTNSYGLSKLSTEQWLAHYEKAYGIRSICLRYFNACGADPAGTIGEDHRPEHHLIPIIMQVALKKRSHINIFGVNYPTPDGTCIRDYIHVSDLAEAHILALEALLNGAPSTNYNLGNGSGYSVREVIEVSRAVTGHPIPALETGRRAGDPARLIASSEKIIRELHWNPRYPDLEQIISTAWNWHKQHPDGFTDQEM